MNNAIEILLVEDNPDDVDLTLRAMRKQRLANNIHVVADGAEALDFVFCNGMYSDRNKANQPKVILLDLKLPKIGGIDVLRRLKENELTKDIPVVVLTSSREERDVVETYKLNVNSYIVKPVDFEKFTSAIQNIGYYWLILNHPPIT